MTAHHEFSNKIYAYRTSSEFYASLKDGRHRWNRCVLKIKPRDEIPLLLFFLESIIAQMSK
jgi:hypothetical protein